MRNEKDAKEDRASGVTLIVPWRVTSVGALPEYRLAVRFADGTEGEVDLSQLVASAQAGVFSTLRDRELLAKVFLELGAVAWPGGIDLAPDAMYDAIREHGCWVLE